MSRSYRKTSVCGFTTCESDKPYKQAANRKARAEMRRRLNEDAEDAESVDIREVSSVWLFGKDGKQWFGDSENEDMRKRLCRK